MSGIRTSSTFESKPSDASNARASNRFSDLYKQAPTVPETTNSDEAQQEVEEERPTLREFVRSKRFVLALAAFMTFTFAVFGAGFLFSIFERRELFDASSTFSPVIEEYASFEDRDRAFAFKEFELIRTELSSRTDVDSREFERKVFESYSPRVWRYVLELRETDTKIQSSKFIDSDNFVSEHWRLKSE